MVNYQQQGQQFIFFVNGGDSRTTRWAFLAPGLGVALILGLYMGFFRSYVPPNMEIFVWVFLGILVLLMIVVILRKLSQGEMSRFEVRIHFGKGSISAYDREENCPLWEDEFNPSRLSSSKIQVIIRGEVFYYPALIYGDRKLDLVEDGVPYPDKVLLCFGEEDEIKELQDSIQTLAIEAGL